MTRADALLILAGPFDAEARAFAAVHAEARALLLTPRDLSREGWRLRLGDPSSLVAVCGARRLDAGEIGGVLTRLPCVAEADIPHIGPEDRAYVAGEMTAFLLAFLGELRCPISNRPTPQCLCGPLWSPERWRRLARELGLPVREGEPRLAALGEEPPPPIPADAVTTIVGDAIFGEARFGEATRVLAHASGADMLQAEFNGEGLLRASPLVNLGAEDIAAAALALFETAMGLSS
ncbi:MAG: hypothetical protein HYS06_07265 [Methylocystis sp.]|nr:hypothetical protein [Methylocystis sp.]